MKALQQLILKLDNLDNYNCAVLNLDVDPSYCVGVRVLMGPNLFAMAFV